MKNYLFTPQAIAYFSVKIPIKGGWGSDVETSDRAKEIVERYLYSGTVTGVDFSGETWYVQVMTTSDASLDDLRSRISQQRDRLSSGLYGTTEPVFFDRAEA